MYHFGRLLFRTIELKGVYPNSIDVSPHHLFRSCDATRIYKLDKCMGHSVLCCVETDYLMYGMSVDRHTAYVGM